MGLSLTSPHWQKCLAAFHWSFWFLLLPTIGDRPLDNPLLVIFTWWPFIHSGQLPRLQRWTKRAHSRKREARATTGASWREREPRRWLLISWWWTAFTFGQLKINVPGPEQQQGWMHQEWFLARSSSGGTGSASFPDEWLPNSPRSCSSWLPDWLQDAPGNREVLVEKVKCSRSSSRSVRTFFFKTSDIAWRNIIIFNKKPPQMKLSERWTQLSAVVTRPTWVWHVRKGRVKPNYRSHNKGQM